MTLKVGDRVRVTTHRHGDNQFGMEGDIIETDRAYSSLDLKVKFDDGTTNSYSTADVQLIDGPVRTVTRREVVEGVWDHVAVCPHEPRTVLVGFEHPYDQHFRAMTASELKAAAAVLLELAGALEE